MNRIVKRIKLSDAKTLFDMGLDINIAIDICKQKFKEKLLDYNNFEMNQYTNNFATTGMFSSKYSAALEYYSFYRLKENGKREPSPYCHIVIIYTVPDKQIKQVHWVEQSSLSIDLNKYTYLNKEGEEEFFNKKFTYEEYVKNEEEKNQQIQ